MMIKLPRLFCLLCLIGFSMSSNASLGQETPMTADQIAERIGRFQKHFPSHSITTSQEAQAALDQSVQLRTEIESWYQHAQTACYERFFVNMCLNDLKLTRRTYSDALQTVVVEAKQLQRKIRLQELDDQTAAKNGL